MSLTFFIVIDDGKSATSEREKVDKCELTVLQLLEKQISTAIQARPQPANKPNPPQEQPATSKKHRDKNKKAPLNHSIRVKIVSLTRSLGKRPLGDVSLSRVFLAFFKLSNLFDQKRLYPPKTLS